ncbi:MULTISPECIES: protein YibB [Acinetobacter]|uniref:protein YibB n=1 Tax=Acinetobacter TaxID=469 RepID=UPI00101F4020|nr:MULTISPECIES: protein YibB [Acinetobacter]MDM1757795.1 protein YibB [Acinetobacter sp. 256-1]MDM1761891.1 protein YibB [Acinetobacter sp. 251-1]RYL25953.1 protein YibB [Acinetobacter piscicola]
MSITIITAFFDIGRGGWSVENGHPCYLQRSNEKYFKYFSNLAQLENDMVIFTSQDYVDQIREIRGDKPTTIINVCLDEKFADIKQQISKIQNSEIFREKIGAEQLKNPEYWSPEYVLVTNLKSYFVNKAIKEGLVHSQLAAWVDFGYCRNLKMLSKIKKWNFTFAENKVHFFSIKKTFELTAESVQHAIFNNQAFIIGGVIVAAPEKWVNFSKLVYMCQKQMLEQNIVDDDQGIYLQTLLVQPDLFEIHYLGEDQWFDVFKRYDEKTHSNFVNRFKKFMGYF